NGSSIAPGDTVYEIGPGKGIITHQLARRCQRLIAIEKDPRLAALLRQQFACQPHVIIHTADFLSYPLPHQPYKIVANIPFNITAAIIARLTTAANPPEDACLAIQREAAAALLGQPHETLRSILLKPWFAPAILHRFHRADFAPEPQVDVVMLRLRKRGPPLISHRRKQSFHDFVTYSFTARQPTLADALKSLFSGPQFKRISRAVGFPDDATPTSLTFAQWLHLFECFQEHASAQARLTIAGSEQRLLHQQSRLQKIHQTRIHCRTT
ncbi:MAG TPA: rRNA adenine N(6)-methyltransferase family protein, partial [Ktedonobacterales bacterium]|nr:rRNA adenine N(6)-methyltransferase family protein [Ktedonobacterales bacterium]